MRLAKPIRRPQRGAATFGNGGAHAGMIGCAGRCGKPVLTSCAFLGPKLQLGPEGAQPVGHLLPATHLPPIRFHGTIIGNGDAVALSTQCGGTRPGGVLRAGAGRGAGELAADDLVRETWNPDWRPAVLAVGLFHMAGRQDLVDRWEAEQAELRRLEEERRVAAAVQAAEEIETAWQRRLREVQAEERERATLAQAERTAELVAQTTRTEIDSTLAAALDELDARERALEPSRWQRWRQTLQDPGTLHRVFRWGLVLAAPNLLAWWILRWSEVEAQRFPDRATLAAGWRPFPGWGHCEPALYFFLLLDVMLLGGVAAYLLARTLERYVED